MAAIKKHRVLSEKEQEYLSEFREDILPQLLGAKSSSWLCNQITYYLFETHSVEDIESAFEASIPTLIAEELEGEYASKEEKLDAAKELIESEGCNYLRDELSSGLDYWLTHLNLNSNSVAGLFGCYTIDDIENSAVYVYGQLDDDIQHEEL